MSAESIRALAPGSRNFRPTSIDSADNSQFQPAAVQEAGWEAKQDNKRAENVQDGGGASGVVRAVQLPAPDEPIPATQVASAPNATVPSHVTMDEIMMLRVLLARDNLDDSMKSMLLKQVPHILLLLSAKQYAAHMPSGCLRNGVSFCVRARASDDQ
jgi:hypothetical protein